MKLAMLTLLALTGSTGLAHADRLDGDWCSASGDKLTIDGKMITTPAGQIIEGIYGRHRFQYSAPEGGWEAGKDIHIRQLSDTLMMLRAGDGPEAEWRPCAHIS